MNNDSNRKSRLGATATLSLIQTPGLGAAQRLIKLFLPHGPAQRNFACLAVFLVLFWNGSAAAAPNQIVSRNLPAAAMGLTAIGRVPETTNLDLTIGLPLRNQADLSELLQQLYDPASAQFHHFLTPEQFNERFSPDERDYEAVKTFARNHGLTITRTVRSRTILGVRGPVADIEKAFHVTLRVYQHPTEPRTFYAPDSDLSLDAGVPVLSVAGLDNYVVPHPMSLRRTPALGKQKPKPASGSAPGGYYMGNDFRAAYIPGIGLTGTGQSVALLEFDSGYYQSDITAYEGLAGLPNVPVQAVLLDGWGGGPGDGNDEVSLDIEMVISMAPGVSTISVVEGGYTDDILTELADPSQGEPLSYQLSASWTYGIDATSDELFQRFATQGQSFFNASGDSDAYCDENPVPTPTGDTNITSVGGTTLFTTGPGGAYVSESVWNWDDGVGGSGGITSYPIPPWQQGINMTTNLGSTTLRNIPDVALTANQIWVLYGAGQSNWFGGTSCATPLWAAFTALVNEQASASGKPTMGFMNPALYAFGESSHYGTLFHDVVNGNNTNSYCGILFPACAGFDLCTGWGTPTPALISALSEGLDPLQITPGTGFWASGGKGGPFTVTSMTLVLTNAGTNALNWSLSNTSIWLNASPSSGILTPGGPATTVPVSLNTAASNLTVGTYSASLAFTNLSDGFGQLRQFQLTVLSPPMVVSQPANQAVLEGTTATFSVGATGGLPLSYQWQFNGRNLTDGGSISGSMTTNLAVSDVTAANVGSYDVIITNLAGVTVSSNATLTIVPSAPVITVQPANQTALVGGPAYFGVSVIGTTPYFYQWTLNGTDLPAATNNPLVLTNLQLSQAGKYAVVVTNVLGSATSSNALLSVFSGTSGLITFDDLSGDGEPVPSGYGGLAWGSWSNFYSLNGSDNPDSGYYAGVVSPPNIAYNGNGDPAAISSPLPFDFISAYFTAAWNDGLQLEVKGWVGATLAYDNTYTLNATNPTLITLNYLDVNTLEFISYGGTPHSGYNGSGEHFAMDNVSVLLPPEPTLETLYSFTGPDGGSSYGAMVQGRDGNFYGTTAYGGGSNYGAVFRMSTNGVLTRLASFNYSDGAYPFAGLIQGSDGNFYGTTEEGGTDGDGTVFRMTTNGTLTTLVNFNYSGNGGYPDAPLAQGSDGNFYGTTADGGSSYDGTAFRMTTNGTLTTLVSFNNTNGAYPYAGLVQGSDGNFYGTTEEGGTDGDGTLFRMTTNGTLTTLVNFNYSGNGGYPYAGLVQGSDGNFYGTTEGGGTDGYGTVFRVTTNGALTTLVNFNDSDGAYPFAGLSQGSDGNFYGTTEDGGALGTGTIFRMMTNGTIGNISFTGTNGASPQAALLEGSDGNLYGTTAYGGIGYNGDYSSGDGTVFCIQFSPRAEATTVTAQPISRTVRVGGTATFTVQAASTEAINYYWQSNGVYIANAAGPGYSAYTITNIPLSASGSQISCLVSNSLGSSFSSNAILTVLSANVTGPMYMFSGPDGGMPSGQLVQGSDGNFYGTTAYGGSSFDGTAFRVTTNGALITLVNFNYSGNGGYPYAGLVQGSDGNFYGTTAEGGTFNGGTVFRLTTSGTITTLANFDYSDGDYPYGGLVQASDGNYYGTTEYGGTNGYGTVFRVTTNGALTTLVSFNYSGNGGYPYAGLVQGSDGNFYGTTEGGGTDGDGTVFRMTTNGTLTTLVNFNYSGNGGYPYAGLVQGSDGNFYGTTAYGGSSYEGTAFRMTTSGVLTTLVNFNYSDGAVPYGGLIQGSDGNFYGTTESGGNEGEGTVFQMTTNGTLTNLFAFAGTNGTSPEAALLEDAEGNLYGTTAFGGVEYDGDYSSGEGTLFRLVGAIIPGPPTIVTQPLSQTVAAGGSATFAVSATGSPPLSYFWLDSGATIPGATNSSFTTNNVPLSANGSQFSCLVSNAYGTALSSNATLIVNTSTSGNVAVYGAPANTTWNSDVTGNISNTLLFSQVSGFLAGSGQATPTLAQLEQYSAVLVYSDAPFNDNVGMGNVLADYVDAGGGVVIATFGFNSASDGLLGRLVTGGYLPLTTGDQTGGTELTLVADQPSHPILDGVTAFNGGTSSFHDLVTTNSGASLVAHWTDGTPLVATMQLTAGRVVALNFYPPSSNVRSDFWQTNTEGGLLLANALLWAGGGAPFVISTTNSWNGTNYILSFGYPNTGTYGQTFIPPSQSSVLTSFTVYIENTSASVNFRFYVMAWNGSEATGPILYQSPETTTAGTSGFQAYTFNTGHLALTPGATYVAFGSITPDCTGQADWGSPTNYSYTNGCFVYNNNGTNFSSLTNSTWSNFSSSDLAFVAVFGGGSGGVAPSIVSSPSNQTVVAGGSATFVITASGTSPLSYSWLDNGVAIPGANSTSFTTNNVPLSANSSQFSCLVSNAYGTALSSSATLTVVSGAAATNVVFVHSSVGDPWDSDDDEIILRMVFGSNWQTNFYETVSPAALFSPTNTFIFMEGSDDNADAMASFLSANLALMQNWVSNGGSLFLNAAPNEGTNINFGFGVTLLYPDYASSAEAVNPAAPIFNGPFSPVGTNWTGNDFAQGIISGTGLNPIIENANNNLVVLAETSAGLGHVLFGGMTLPRFHSPQPQGTNLLANILSYGASQAARPALVVGISPDGNAGEFNALAGTLTNFGFPVLIVTNSPWTGVNVLVSYPSCSSTNGSVWGPSLTDISNGVGYVKISDWGTDWTPVSYLAVAPGTPITMSLGGAHPITAGLPASWMAQGFWNYGDVGYNYVAWSTDTTLSNLAGEISPANETRLLVANSIGTGRAVFIGWNVYGTNAGPNDLAVLRNAILWAGKASNLTIGPVNSNPTNIVFSVTGNQLNLSWPFDHTGWQLETTTNLLSTNWVNVGGSAATNKVVVSTTNPEAFYRLVYPY